VKILIAHGTPVTRISGFCIAVKSLYKGLKDLGHNVIFVCPSNKDARTSDYSFKSPLGIWRIPNIIDKYVYKKVKNFQPDIVHNHDVGFVGIAAMKYAYDSNIPTVLTVHSKFRDYLKAKLPNVFRFLIIYLVIRYLKRYINLCDAVIAPTKDIQKYLKREGVERRVIVQPSGIYLDSFKYKTRKYKRGHHKLLMVGLLVKGKNIPCLLHMMKYLDADKFSLDIVGGGNQKNRLSKLIRKLNLKNVHLCGPVQNSHVNKYYRKSDLFISASITESQGLVYLEAMSSGLPIVSFSNSGSRSILGQFNVGELVNKSNPKLFAQKVKNIFKSPSLYEKYSRNAFKASKRYNIKRTVKETVRIYKDVLNKK